MTAKEFEEIQSEYACWQCHRVGMVRIVPHPSDATHPGKLVCSHCQTYQLFLSKEKNANKRPSLTKEVRDKVWSEWGNACSHCGITAADLAFIGVMRTVQHAPPYRDAGNGANLIPYCEWCQQRSESESKRIRSLIERLRHNDPTQ